MMFFNQQMAELAVSVKEKLFQKGQEAKNWNKPVNYVCLHLRLGDFEQVE
jgi:hypothetical protein